MAEPQPPVLGKDRMRDFARPRSPEQPEYITIGKDAWMWDSTSWDPRRIREGRVDAPTSAEIVQRLEHPADAGKKSKRASLEVIHRWTGKDGTQREKKFWVHTGRYGFQGMPKPEKIEADPSLNL